MDLPRPAATLFLMVAAVGVIHLQLIVTVVFVRAAVDWNNHVREEWERFNDVVRTLSEYPGEATLLESEEWSAGQTMSHRAESLQIHYETPEGDRIEVTTWTDFVTDAIVDHDGLDPTDALRYGRDRDHRACEKAEEAGLSVEIRSREEDGLDDLSEMASLLRPAGEGDTVALAEEITGGSRL